MGIGIQICGLNGCGKSTLGRALAQEIGFHFIDNEQLYFERTSADEPYASPKPREEVEKLLMAEVTTHPNFVFAAVKGDYGKDIIPMYSYVIVVDVPRELRLQRVWDRSFKKFGERMLAGGDLYEQEIAFMQAVEAREDAFVENWLKTLACPIIRVDGTKPIEENVKYITHLLNG